MPGGRVPGLVYTIPNFQNPGGMTLSRAKRERLVALARAHGFLVLEDDPYGELRFERRPTSRACSRSTRVPATSSTRRSFTKTVAPGIRAGPMVLPPELHATIRKLADRHLHRRRPCCPRRSSREYCAAGAFEPGVDRMKAALRERRDALVAASTATSATACAYVAPAGGYFLWVDLPGVDADALADAAAAPGRPVVKGSTCFIDGRGRDALRLAYSACPAGDMDEGMARLAALL